MNERDKELMATKQYKPVLVGIRWCIRMVNSHARHDFSRFDWSCVVRLLHCLFQYV